MGELSERALELFEELCELAPREQEQRLAQLDAEESDVSTDLRSLLQGDRRRDARVDRVAAELILGQEETPHERAADPPERPVGSERYQLGEEIGAGGMGEVLRAWDPDLERELAIKRLSGSAGATGETRGRRTRRFLREARITGQLDHPGIVPVHELGTDRSGDPYFTMKLVRGRPLDDDSHEWGLTRRVEGLLRACEAVAYAHSKGIVHRDLKPANILMGDYGEVYVVDWGVARVLDEPDDRDLRPDPEAETAEAPSADTAGSDGSETFTTRDGTVMGTPRYMPPEQARGDAGEVGPRSDVYALGTILYKLIAGKPPYSEIEGSSSRILAAVRSGPPRPLGAIAPKAPAELIAIAQRCMQRDPAERYATVRHLILDLRAYLEGRVVVARPVGVWMRFAKWARRNRLAAALAAVGLVIAGGAAIGFYFQDREIAQRESSRARVFGLLVRAIESLQPAEVLGEGEVESVLAAVLGELDSTFVDENDDSLRADLIIELGELLLSRGRFRDALSFLEDELTRFPASDGGRPGDRARIEGLMARASHRLGDYDKAESLFAEAEEAASPTNAREQAQAISNKALVVEERGDFETALFGHEEALQLLADRPDSDEDKLTTMERVVSVLRKLGRYEEGVGLARRVVAGRSETLGDRHPHTIHARHTLGIQLLRLKQHDEALELLESVLDDRRRILAEGDPELFQALTNLGDVYTEVGRHDDALASYEEALEGFMATLGEQHWNTIACMNGYATALSAAGDIESAATVAENTLALASETLGPGHPFFSYVKGNLGFLYARLGRIAEGIELVEQAVQQIDSLQAPEHPHTLQLRWLLSGLYSEADRPDEALVELDRILAHAPPGSSIASRAAGLRSEIEQGPK